MSADGEWVAVQHVPFEGPGAIAAAANRAGHELRRVHPYRGEPLPAVEELAGLVVMGGPMSVNDAIAHPHLRDELELIDALLALGKPLLGVCLGAQLIASALGARVHPGDGEEVGVGTVTLSDAGAADPVLGAPTLGDGRTLPVVHWHGETFELPRGSELLASSDRYRHQAFRYGEHAYALQFHVEIDAPLANEWAEHLPPGVEIAADARASIEAVGEAVLDAFFAVAGA
jgi:GMP synthase (glutamine-hydrolysing)